MKNIKKVTSCRVCKGKSFVKVLTLGPTPLANALLTKERLDGPEYFYPLDVYFCTNCALLQLGHVVSPSILFKDYVYVSSTSQVFVSHFQEFANNIVDRFSLNKMSLVIDIGSNDGILLAPFKEKGMKVVGIEPATNIAKVAREKGIKTVTKFFSNNVAKQVVGKKGKAKVVTATNVFAHIDDLDKVILGVQTLLDDDGVFIIEAPYLVDFLEKRYFDLVYHEHLSYWAVKPLITLFQRFGMDVFDVQKVAAHGGSIRVFVKKSKAPFKKEKRVAEFLKIEKEAKLSQVQTYHTFADDILENKVALISMLAKLKAQHKRVAGYGAPAKGQTLLNFFGIGKEFLDYIVDDSPWKQGLYSPGKRIPVMPTKHMYKDKVDYMLILAWNFAESIMKMHTKFKHDGGRFIIPIPMPRIV